MHVCECVVVVAVASTVNVGASLNQTTLFLGRFIGVGSRG